MNSRVLLLTGIIPLLILLVVPHVYAESSSKRASDGFREGSDAATTDSSYNPACDPTGQFTSDGQHTSTYCNAWTDGYTSTWNSIHGGDQTDQTQTQSQQQDQRQNQQVHNCIALKCEIIQGGSQGQDQGANQGSTGGGQ